MLMHTKGILVMTPDSAMVLTGKQSLDFSGGVSAEDNFGIGGYDRVMGPNGQAQYWAPDLAGGHRHPAGPLRRTPMSLPGGDGPRHAPTTDPVDRDVSDSRTPLDGRTSPPSARSSRTRRTPTARSPSTSARSSRALVCDQDHPRVERWAGWPTPRPPSSSTPGSAVIPYACSASSRSRCRASGFPPTDGPDTYTAGTLFPVLLKKAARAINAASGNRPLVVLANLSGFDGSPESMRNLQLEYGAEIGRAIVNFQGPIVFVVISRYHGGAFVVFSKALNPRMTVLAIEGSFASVLGGAPAAAVVFSRDVDLGIPGDDAPRPCDLVADIAPAGGRRRRPGGGRRHSVGGIRPHHGALPDRRHRQHPRPV
jgi:hypothetical protein